VERYLFSSRKSEAVQNLLPSDIDTIDTLDLCTQFNCLPEAGGLHDQDPDLIAKFNIILSITAKKAEYDEKIEEMNRKARQPQRGGIT
jgi:hypothetical protein